ncbi:hypothetical protein [Streptomyces sp. cmx-4-9]|uniref:hypothetical protein n=1 Tax=Streptomyces sp. cmx-4-9 TaxID=2790941 RepID=UPI003980F2FD
MEKREPFHSALTLRILFGWLGNAAPIPEQDIRLLNEVGLRTRRTLRFLADNSLVIPDTARQSEPRGHVSHRIIANLPSSSRPEIGEWVVLLRREDRNGRPHTRYATIRNYRTYAHPALVEWGRRYRTLREVTPADVDAAIEAQAGEAARHMGIALRSIFRTLKRNKTIFRDSTRGIVVPHGPTRPPRTLPAIWSPGSSTARPEPLIAWPWLSSRSTRSANANSRASSSTTCP